jgi:hypothetical protein
LHGVGGKTYYLGSNGIVYYREANGAFRSFGRTIPLASLGTNLWSMLQGASKAEAGMTPNTSTAITITTPEVLPRVNHAATPGAGALPTAPFAPETPFAPGDVSGRSSPTNAPPTITGAVEGNGGKIFYVGSNDFIYYRGKDGGLYIFGSGVPEFK